jgi:hypothetical protein
VDEYYVETLPHTIKVASRVQLGESYGEIETQEKGFIRKVCT